MNGVIPLYKPRGMTSHDCVAILRGILKTKKVGHTGTLDPDVDGVLPICVGVATKAAPYILDSGKTYRGEITLGFSTDTQDISGNIITTKTIKDQIEGDKIHSAMQKLTGHITQVPPIYSAVKVNGRKLYEYARENIPVEIPKRKIDVFSFDLIDGSIIFDKKNLQQKFKFEVKCGKGTYVRTLATDLGKILNVPATMTDLTRIYSGGFKKEETVTFDDIKEAIKKNSLDFLINLEEIFSKYPKYDIDEIQKKKLYNGATLKLSGRNEEVIAIYDGKVFKALYEQLPSSENIYKPKKMFLNNDGK